MFIRAAIAAIVLALACDPPAGIEPRNLPLPEEHDKQAAKVGNDAVAGDIASKCLDGGWPAVLTIEVLEGPDQNDHYRYRFEIEGQAHHDQVACLRERVMLEQQP